MPQVNIAQVQWQDKRRAGLQSTAGSRREPTIFLREVGILRRQEFGTMIPKKREKSCGK